jgi:hypothetical protein
MPVHRDLEIMIIILLLTTLSRSDDGCKIFFESGCQSCFAKNNKLFMKNHQFRNGMIKMNITYETSAVLVSWKQVNSFESFLYYFR